jgi:predicted RND superfamily exporter protein
MMLENSFYENAIQSLSLCVAFAFLILIIVTRNVIVAVFNVISMAGVLLTVCATLYLIGWDLGMIESCGLDLFVGFSVDYIVHVGHCYVDSIYEDRKQRMDEAFKNIGFAVISGCITTFISSCFLVACQVLMLYEFGILLQITLISSLYYSLVFFPAISYIIGPEYHKGDLIYWIWKPIK